MRRLVTKRHLILIFLALLLQSSLSTFFQFGGRPDFFYLLILDYAFFWQWQWVPLFAFIIGLLRDFIGGHLFGVETVSLTLTGSFLYLAVQKLERENGWVRYATTILFISLTESISFSLALGLEISRDLPFNMIGSIFWTTLYTTALAVGFFRFTDWWFQRSSIFKQYELFR